MEYKVHRKEKIYYFLMAAISILCYTTLASSLLTCSYDTFLNMLKVPTVMICIFYASIILVFSFISKICFLGFLRGNAIKVTPSQFPKLFEILKSHCQKLGMSSIPNTYVLQGNGILNAFAAKILRNNLVVLNSGVVELIDDNQYDVVSFIIGHELGHIKRGHVGFKEILTFPASLIFPLRLAYSRAREYTCDNIGYNLCPAGAVNGMLVLACGAKLYKKIDTKELLLSFAANSGFVTSFAEFFSTHPLVIKRVRVLNDLNKQNLHVDSFTFNSPKIDKFTELN
jgi:Zn-dependent protease with chaperone function